MLEVLFHYSVCILPFGVEKARARHAGNPHATVFYLLFLASCLCAHGGYYLRFLCKGTMVQIFPHDLHLEVDPRVHHFSSCGLVFAFALIWVAPSYIPISVVPGDIPSSDVQVCAPISAVPGDSPIFNCDAAAVLGRNIAPTLGCIPLLDDHNATPILQGINRSPFVSPLDNTTEVRADAAPGIWYSPLIRVEATMNTTQATHTGHH